jgi:uncharacterized delta-60 repeat protein
MPFRSARASRSWLRIVLTAVIAGFALSAPADRALAASGDLDETFGSEGVAVAPFGGSIGYDVVRQPDGKLIAAGGVYATPPQPLAIARFDANGVLDPSFGGDGLVTTDVGPLEDAAAESNADGDILLIRYEADGSLDTGFGTGGIVVTSLGTATDFAHAGALQADGKILVTGGLNSTTTTSADLFVLRYESDGSLDGTFGTGGLATLDFGGRGDEGTAVVVQADGMIVVSGSSFDGPLFADGAIATLTRLDTSGVPDPLFGSGGSVTLAVDTINIFKALALQPDGKIVVLGGTGPLNLAYRLFRYDSTGNPDGGFSGDPIPVFPQMGTPKSFALQADGKFAVAGRGGYHFKAARMNDDGSVDTTFGQGGSSYVATGTFDASDVAISEPSGDILLAGSADPVGDPRGVAEITVARLKGASPACATDADCGSCERCGAGSVCEIGARSGCTDAASRAAQLKFNTRGWGAALTLRWRGTVPSFDPTASDDLAICFFHNGNRVLKAVAPAGGLCESLPCWTGGAGSFDYDDRDATPHGIRRIQIESDRVKLKAKGEELTASPQGFPDPLPLGPLGPALLLQLHAGNGACMEATFDTDRKVTAYRFRSKND